MKEGAFAGLGEALVLLRKERGLTQKEVAEAAGMSSPTLSRFETASEIPKLDVLSRILDALEADLPLLHYALLRVNGRPTPALQIPDSLSLSERAALQLTFSSFRSFLEISASRQAPEEAATH